MSSDFFEQRRKRKPPRRADYRMPHVNSYLIVTEGSDTEPNYLNGLKKKILSYAGGTVDVIDRPLIRISGKGEGTCRLVDETAEIVKRSKTYYQNIWVVFDKDEFSDFDEAVRRAESYGFQVAWSNSSFEYWLYLHFEYSRAALHRNEWEKKLNQKFVQYHLNHGKYEKNDEQLFQELDSLGTVDKAVGNAKRRMSEFDGRIKPSRFDPGTMVYKLVEQLMSYLD